LFSLLQSSIPRQEIRPQREDESGRTCRHQIA